VCSSDLFAGRETLSWSPSSMRGRDISLVVMNATGDPKVGANLAATVNPRWLNPTTWGLLILGTVLFVLGSAALVWPRRHRDIVYVVEPSQLPEIAARLGVDTRTGPPASGYRARPAGVDRGEPARPATAPTGGTAPTNAIPAPWFARVGGSPPHASSVAPTGRQQTFLPRTPRTTIEDAPAETEPVEESAAEDRAVEGSAGEGSATNGPTDDPTDDDLTAAPADADALTWPPVRPVVQTPPVSRTEPETGLRAPIKVTLDPFDPCRDRGELAGL